MSPTTWALTLLFAGMTRLVWLLFLPVEAALRAATRLHERGRRARR